MPLAVVLPDKIGHAIVAHDDVRIAVIVVVGTDDTHARSRVRSDARLAADIGESAVPVVVKEGGGNGSVDRGPDVGGVAIEISGLMLDDGEVDVIGDEKVEFAIVVDVHKASACADLVAIADPGGLGDIGEGAVSI